MSFAAKYLKAHGQTATVLRSPPDETYVSIKRVTKAVQDLAVREAYWEGLILADSNLSSGEILQIADDKYLVHFAVVDHASGEMAWFGAKTNATLIHQRVSKTADKGHITETWQDINTGIAAFGDVVTMRMRQYDPGLLDNTIYLFQVQKSFGVQTLDRLVYNSMNLKVESIDNIGLAGVVRVQCSVDVRP